MHHLATKNQILCLLLDFSNCNSLKWLFYVNWCNNNKVCLQNSILKRFEVVKIKYFHRLVNGVFIPERIIVLHLWYINALGIIAWLGNPWFSSFVLSRSLWLCSKWESSIIIIVAFLMRTDKKSNQEFFKGN